MGKMQDTYAYDALDRLTGFTGYDGFEQRYTLDSNGLRTTMQQKGGMNRLTIEEMLQGKQLEADAAEPTVDAWQKTSYIYDVTLPYGQMLTETTNGSTTSYVIYQKTRYGAMVFQMILFALVSCFYAAYFTKQIFLHKKGIATNRLAKGSKPQKTATIEAYLLAATYATAAIQYASIFLPRYLLPFEMPAALRWVGITVTALGVLFFLLAITAMRDSWRAGVDESQKTAMVTTGVYKISRNPAFVGFDFLYIGTALTMPNAIMLCAGAISMVLVHLQILQEEAYLPRAFGTAYLRYKAKVPRYLLFF